MSKITEPKNLLKNFITKVFLEVIYKSLIPAVVALFGVLVSKYLPFLKEVPWYIITIVIVALISFVAIAYRLLKWFIERAFKRYKIYKNSGIFDYRPNKTSEDKTKNEAFLLEQVKSAGSIKIIGATGYQTFAKSDATGKAVLREVLENISGEIKILLLHPNTEQTKMRAKALGVLLETYQRDIANSIQFLKELKIKGKSVALKLYSQRPIWKMIIADDFLWLQYYDPKEHVEYTPVYGIKRDHNNYTLFEPLSAVFTKKWEHDNNPTYDFDTGSLMYPDRGTEKINL